MGASGLVSDSDYQGLEERSIKLARYLKILTIEQEEEMIGMLPGLNYIEIMEVINTFDPVKRKEKIGNLKKK